MPVGCSGSGFSSRAAGPTATPTATGWEELVPPRPSRTAFTPLSASNATGATTPRPPSTLSAPEETTSAGVSAPSS